MSGCDDDEPVTHFLESLYTLQRTRHWLWSHDARSIIDFDFVVRLNWRSPVRVLTHIFRQCMFPNILRRDHLLSNSDSLYPSSQVGTA